MKERTDRQTDRRLKQSMNNMTLRMSEKTDCYVIEGEITVEKKPKMENKKVI